MRIVLFTFFTLFFSFSLFATPTSLNPQPVTLQQQDKEALQKIEESLNAIQTLKAHFNQKSRTAQGQVSESKGVFLISRLKGESTKFRFEYAPPAKIMILAMGNNVMYYDNELDQKTPIDLKSTPAAFLADKEIKFNINYLVTNFIREDSLIKLRIVQKKDPVAGFVDLIFDNAYNLKGWRLIDAHGTDTTIELTSKEKDVKFNPNIFKFYSPETGGKPRPLFDQ